MRKIKLPFQSSKRSKANLCNIFVLFCFAFYNFGAVDEDGHPKPESKFKMIEMESHAPEMWKKRREVYIFKSQWRNEVRQIVKTLVHKIHFRFRDAITSAPEHKNNNDERDNEN